MLNILQVFFKSQLDTHFYLHDQSSLLSVFIASERRLLTFFFGLIKGLPLIVEFCSYFIRVDFYITHCIKSEE